jgi:hypothetical protein
MSRPAHAKPVKAISFVVRVTIADPLMQALLPTPDTCDGVPWLVMGAQGWW